MSTMQAVGRVVDQRVDDASTIRAVARRARQFFQMMNAMPRADEAEAIFWRKQAGAAAEQNRNRVIARHGPVI